jgi:hypothetical protein
MFPPAIVQFRRMTDSQISSFSAERQDQSYIFPNHSQSLFSTRLQDLIQFQPLFDLCISLFRTVPTEDAPLISGFLDQRLTARRNRLHFLLVSSGRCDSSHAMLIRYLAAQRSWFTEVSGVVLDIMVPLFSVATRSWGLEGIDDEELHRSLPWRNTLRYLRQCWLICVSSTSVVLSALPWHLRPLIVCAN